MDGRMGGWIERVMETEGKEGGKGKREGREKRRKKEEVLSPPGKKNHWGQSIGILKRRLHLNNPQTTCIRCTAFLSSLLTGTCWCVLC